MNIEFRFLQKAIEDKNFIGFLYQNIKYNEIKPLKLIIKEDIYYLHTQNEIYEFEKIKKLQISKKKFIN